MAPDPCRRYIGEIWHDLLDDPDDLGNANKPQRRERCYWMRFKVSANTTAITFTITIRLTAPGETANGPQMIKAFAPAGWTLDKYTGHST